LKSYIPDYDLVPAANLEEVLALLANGEGWRPMAGGTDLMVLLNSGKLAVPKLVSIRSIQELNTITVTEEDVTVGAAVTFNALRHHPLLQQEFPLLPLAASWTGGIANQNRGTLGGNIVNASPAADSPPALLAYDATISLLSRRGRRTLPYREFHTGYKQMQLEPDELLYSITLPRKFAGWRYYSRKVGARRAQAISKVCLSALCATDQRVVRDIRIGIGSVAPVPLRCRAAEQALQGQELSAKVIQNAKAALHAEIAPIDDIRSTAVYRSRVAENLLGEFLSGLL
jgi:CO/xanthine dehydrogenase FAD-binding subunit